MKLPGDSHEKVMSAYQLLSGPSFSFATFEQVRTILKGIHPEIDAKLEICSKALGKVQKLQAGDLVSLSVESLPESTENQRKKKKALLFFIQSISNLKSEIKRIDIEFSQGDTSTQSQLSHWGRVVKYAKGPFGLITLAALLIVGVSFVTNHKTAIVQKNIPISPTGKTVLAIQYNGQHIPLSQLYVGHGSDCDSPHYHAITGSVITLSGVTIRDPEGCGFGKIKDVQVITVNK